MTQCDKVWAQWDRAPLKQAKVPRIVSVPRKLLRPLAPGYTSYKPVPEVPKTSDWAVLGLQKPEKRRACSSTAS